MIIKNRAKAILEITRRLTGYGEIVTGNEAEKLILEEYKGVLEDLNPEIMIRKIPVNVISWHEDTSYVEANHSRIEAAAYPYTYHNDVENHHVFIGDCDTVLEKPYIKGVREKLVSVLAPRDIDYIEDCYRKLLVHGVTGIIFIDRYDTLRRFVVTGSPTYTYYSGAPPPIPVVHVSSKHMGLLKSQNDRKLRIYTETSVSSKTGYILEGYIPGRSDEFIIITGHHDHWFGGFHDNLLSLAFMATIVYDLKNTPLKRSLLLVSFTAEESGAPGFAGWYWSYGSRSYVNDLYIRSINAVANINIDMAGREKIHVSATPELQIYVQDIVGKMGERNVSIENDNPYMDSISFSTSGIPALSIHSFPELRHLYHSTMDDYDHAEIHGVSKTYDLYKFIVKSLVQGEKLPYTKGLENIYKEYLTIKAPAEYLSLIFKIYQCTKKYEQQFITMLYSHYYKVVVEEIRDVQELKAMLFPELLLLKDINAMIKNSRKNTKPSLPKRRYLAGYGRELPGLSSIVDTESYEDKEELLKALKDVASKYIEDLLNDVDEFIGRTCFATT